jgi:hypothetical protein
MFSSLLVWGGRQHKTIGKEKKVPIKPVFSYPDLLILQASSEQGVVMKKKVKAILSAWNAAQI